MKEVNMKYLIITIATLLITSNAFSFGSLQLIDCQYKYLGYQQGSKYVGLYKSYSGKYYTITFDSYCPYSYSL